MKRMSVKQLRSGIDAAIYCLERKPNKVLNYNSMALNILKMLSRNGHGTVTSHKVHRRAHTRKQNGKTVRVNAS
jgi:hypothetical protein